MPNEPAQIAGLEAEWRDHLHMRDQSWKSLNYSILFSGGLITLWYNKPDSELVLPMCIAVLVVALFGLLLALHHGRCQKRKLAAITNIERELELLDVLKPVLAKPRAMASHYIAGMHVGLFGLSIFLLGRTLHIW